MGAELLPLNNYLADALRASGASALHGPWAACILDKTEDTSHHLPPVNSPTTWSPNTPQRASAT
eukprot:7691232-Pyramimonas_sp.AAC.1